MPLNKDISNEINCIFNDNTLNDLKRFIQKRQCLNTTNSYLIYLFHFVQSAGILTSSIAAGNNYTNLLWIGIGLNFLATLINVYEKTNNSILKRLLKDIESIKAGTYVDESEMIDGSSLDPTTKTRKREHTNTNIQTRESIPIPISNPNSIGINANSYNTIQNTDISPISTSPNSDSPITNNLSNI